MIATLDEARAQVENGLSDYVEFDADEIAADIVAGVALMCEPEVALELCRIEIGWVPAAVAAMRP